MINKSGNGKQLLGSQLGYHGKGVPDSETIAALQKNYSSIVEARGLPPEVRSKLERMRALAAKALSGEESNLGESEIARRIRRILEHRLRARANLAFQSRRRGLG